MFLDPKAVIRRLESLLAQLSSIESTSDPEFTVWKDEVKLVLKKAYGETSEEYARFNAIEFEIPFSIHWNYENDQRRFNSGVKQSKVFLRARIEDVSARTAVDISDSVPEIPSDPSNKKIFLVHGHDHGMKETIARYVTKAGLEPIILHEQADRARTIIEKFEQHADVSFAIAIFSRDDLGVSAIDAQKSSPEMGPVLQPRARQNVVFECGYFIGRLGRKRVAILHAEGVELMSDYAGVVYIPFDAGDGWRLRLFKELKAAGFNLDANKIF